ncbi:oxidoreductase, short-chain dehydrogenase/reductase family [Citrifermentans bemidjiense Bem]|uniref:Oxidoreductase, short-chain dehydrogenase/reductase family n=1 Tax=Citrifermentans bemidjiense (strain ATCC BAA-1014 / DSM 16622 / JCM 12645 / Bem) TaxID=404380 RepID=B5EDG4_CITBB|nr:SDR family oxidoreductase [Citrifermentans bemidjiense]ACH39160.1 oxidoreductase, short-chain dehydrogenase/reductase family [Citrifermentans bemidjiense Bem]
MAQRVLVTAGASGIGKEIASAYAATGAEVCVCDIDEKALDTAAKDISGLKTIVCDVSKPDDIKRMVTSAIEALGGLDVLVNNAGIAGPTAPVEDVDPDQWEAVMTVDVIGTFHVTRLCIPHLKKSAAGSIVVMSSLGGRFGYPNRSAYCTAKMGLIGFAKTLSRELGPYNIRVNAIAPGAVAGDRIERVLQGRASAEHKTLEEERSAAMSLQSLKRFVDPRDIAALILFLTSDAGKSISGQVLPIDNDAQTSA